MSKIKKNITFILNRDWDFFYLVPGVNYNIVKEKALKTLHEETNNLFYQDLSSFKEWGIEPLNILLYKLIKDQEDFKLIFLNSLNILHYIEKDDKFKDLSGWLKTAVIISWIAGGIMAFAFIVGFLEGLLA
jgi:hypothetical protein